MFLLRRYFPLRRNRHIGLSQAENTLRSKKIQKARFDLLMFRSMLHLIGQTCTGRLKNIKRFVRLQTSIRRLSATANNYLRFKVFPLEFYKIIFISTDEGNQLRIIYV